MLVQEERFEINNTEVVLRCATEADAEVLVDYLKEVSKETRFLLCEPDEVNYTLEQEMAFINLYNESKSDLLLLAFVDGVYAGNCSFSKQGPSRRSAHRVDFGIALYQRYTGMGIGSRLMKKMINEAKKIGYRQCELTVVSTNFKAIKLYKKLGFTECGRIPNANCYADGTSSDNIFMVLQF